MKKFTYISFVIISLSFNSYAQDVFDKNKFVLDLNSAIKADIKGVTAKRISTYPSINQEWLHAVTNTPQDYAVIAMDAKGEPIELFGASTPFEIKDNAIFVPGYELPQGGTYKTVGASGWANAASSIAAKNKPEIDSSIREAVTTISSATDYLQTSPGCAQ